MASGRNGCSGRSTGGRTSAGRTASGARPSCDDCFFKQNLLCAVQASEPCATFRPGGADGLRPPGQLRFVFRTERRQQVAWAFPSANEQVSLHA